MKLKTTLHKLEAECTRKEKLIEEILISQKYLGKSQISKIKADSNVSSAMRKHIRELKEELQMKEDEISRLKKNIRITKFQELELEVKMYMEEWSRLRQLAKDVIRWKDPLMDPQQKLEIDKRFMEQNMIIEQLRNENVQLENAFHDREMEVLRLKELVDENPENERSNKREQSAKDRK